MKKYFLTGLATLIPLAITIYVVIFVVHFLTKPFMGVVTHLLEKLSIGPVGWISSEQVVRDISQILILVGMFVFVLLLGMLARWIFFSSLMKLADRVLHKIPLFNTVYKTTKEIIQTLFVSDKNSFKQVVLLQFPYNGCYCIGLISSHSPKTCSEGLGEDLITVFIPTTPNPTTGFLVVSPKSALIFLEMNTEDAIKYVVSCGVIQPTSPATQ